MSGGVEEGGSRGLEQVRGQRFGSVAPVGGCAREGGFDGRFPVLGAVEGDLQGDEAGGVEDVLVVGGGFGGFGEVGE